MYQQEMKTRYQRGVCSPMFSAVLLTEYLHVHVCLCAPSCLILCSPIDFIWGAPKSLQTVTAAMKLKDAYSLEQKL